MLGCACPARLCLQLIRHLSSREQASKRKHKDGVDPDEAAATDQARRDTAGIRPRYGRERQISLPNGQGRRVALHV